MIRLVAVRAEDRELLWNMNQKYLYEMTNFYPDDMDAQGNYHYGYFDGYFVDPKRKAYFIVSDGKIVGFAMIHPYSVIEHAPDYTMAEFTVFPSYRANHFGSDAVRLIFSAYPGKWEIKFNEKNVPAKAFWTKMTKVYAPSVYRMNAEETVLEFTVR